MNKETYQPTSSIYAKPIPITPKRPPKRRPVFLWAFLTVQAIFLLWIILGIVSAAQHASQYADQAAAYQTGAVAGIGLIILLWALTDVILGVGRWVVLSSRKRQP